MYNLEKKQKIILGIIISIIIGFIFYYVYARDESNNSNLLNNLEIENADTQEETDESEGTEEEYSDKFILVHVSGAVNKEGIVELKINSRIADAIDKARRNKRRCQYR